MLQPSYDFAAQFDFGLELILNGLAAQLQDEKLGQGPRPGSDGGLPRYGFNG